MRRGDRGMAVLEFVVVVVLVGVPLGYAAMAVLRVHTAVVAAQTAASATALAVARGAVPPGAAGRYARGYWPGRTDDVAVEIDCRPGGCGTPGGTVAVIVAASVDFPLVPGQWGKLPVSATGTQVVDRFTAVGS